MVENKTQDTQSVKLRIMHDDSPNSENGEAAPSQNLIIPLNQICEPYLYKGDKKCVAHLIRIHPTRPLSNIKVEVESNPRVLKPISSVGSVTGGYGGNLMIGYGNSTGRKYKYKD